MKRAPFTPTADDLRVLSEHLQYDIQRSFALAHVLDLREQHFQTHTPTLLDTFEHHAILESFLVRTRSVVEFLWHDRRKGQDFLAADYFPPGEWKRMRANRPQQLNRLVTERIGWGGMHLTYRRARATPADKQWVPIRMCAALEPTVRLFIEKVDASQFEAQWFDDIPWVLERFNAQYGHVAL